MAVAESNEPNPALAAEAELQKFLASAPEKPRMSPADETIILGRLEYMLRDPHIFKLIDEEFRDYSPLKLVLSALARTTNLSGAEKQVFKYRAFTALDLILFTKRRDDLSFKELAFVEALKAHLETVAADTFDGWRGKLVTEQFRGVMAAPTEEQKKSWWEKLLGR